MIAASLSRAAATAARQAISVADIDISMLGADFSSWLALEMLTRPPEPLEQNSANREDQVLLEVTDLHIPSCHALPKNSSEKEVQEHSALTKTT